jgi:hypothetical protein
MSKAASMLACPPAKKGRKAMRDGGEVEVPINLGAADSMARSFADGGEVSPYSLKGLARTAASAYGSAVDGTSNAMTSVASRFSRPVGYTPAVAAAPAPAPAPAAAPAPASAITSYASGQQDVMQRREAAAGLADGGAVARMVQGPGTGTSDSIPSKVRHGSYIIPADSTENVLLSNGETELPPEAVHQVGVAALDALRTMTHVPAKQQQRGKPALANGGAVETRPFEYEDDRPSQAAPAGSSYALGIARGGQVAADRGQAMLDDAARQPAQPASADLAAPAAPATPATPAAAPAAAADPDAPMPYGQQMAHVGNALTSMAGTAMKTLVSAPGYGFNRNTGASPAPAASPASAPAASDRGAPGTQTDAQRGGAQPPQVISIPGSQTGGIPGADVAGVPGVKKQTQNGRTLYTNVDDPAGNQALLSGGATKPGNVGGAADRLASSIDPALSAARRAALDRGDISAVRASYGGNFAGGEPAGGPQATVVNARPLGFKTADEQGPASIDTRGMSRRQAANVQLQRDQLASQDARSAEQNQVQREGHAVTARGQDVQAGTAAAQLASTAPGARAEGRLKTVQADAAVQVQAAQRAYMAATTPEARAKAEDNLRALQGKYEKDVPDLFQTSVIPGEVDALGNKSPSHVAVTDKRSGGIKVYDANGQPTGTTPHAKPLPPREQLQAGTVYQTARGAAKWDGKQFVPAQ